MSEVRLRPMTAEEYEAFRERAIGEYAAERVRARHWRGEQARALATAETDELLPDGVHTPGMLLLVAESDEGEAVGQAWVGLDQPQRSNVWIYDLQIVPEQRGSGYGRALLAAIEDEVRRHGAELVSLNVFGASHVARRLYESSGYEIASLQMNKRL